MTKDLHPGLGSGALREALEKHEYMNGSCLCREFRLPPYGKKELDEWALVRGDWMRDIRWKYWLEHVLAALSLSSPIEPQAEPAYVRTCPSCGEGYNAKECDLCHVPTIATERAVRDRESKVAQASSEIREADDAFVTGYEQGFVHAIAEAVEAAEKSDAVGVVESVVRNRIVERVRALAPSRQGAAKRVEG